MRSRVYYSIGNGGIGMSCSCNFMLLLIISFNVGPFFECHTLSMCELAGITHLLERSVEVLVVQVL